MTFVATPSIAWEDVEHALIDWAQDVSGLEAVWAEENAPQPTMPYVVLDWLTPPNAVGEDYFSQEEVDATSSVGLVLEGVRRATLNVQVLSASTGPGRSANYFVDLLLNSLNADTITLDYFAPNRMAIWGFEPIAKGAFAMDKTAISRAGVDVTLGFAAGIGQPGETISTIRNASITATLSSPALTATLSVTS